MNKLIGINLSASEFGQNNDSGNLPGKINQDYFYSTILPEYQYYINKGLKLIRVPIMEERLLPSLTGTLSTPDVDGLTSMLNMAEQVGAKVIIDLHNFSRYYGTPLAIGDTTLASFWSKLVPLYKDHPALFGYGIMNEPNTLPGGASEWPPIVQSVVNAIREIDTNTYILIPGYGWQSAENWVANNANLIIKDPSNKVIYDAHQYFDADGSGTYPNNEQPPADLNIGVERITPFINWLKQNNFQGILTEIGIPTTVPAWFPVLDNVLNLINTTDELVGTTIWSASSWWGSYNLSLEPYDSPTTFTQDKPVMSTITKYSLATPTPVTPTPVPPVIPTPTPTSTTPPPPTIPAFSITGNVSITSDGKGNVNFSLTSKAS